MFDATSFPAQFIALTGNVPFPWQEDLYRRLSRGEIPQACDIPTGLGKTAVIPIWLIALAGRGRDVMRRLLYVVNRRTIVDQATGERVRYVLSLSGICISAREASGVTAHGFAQS